MRSSHVVISIAFLAFRSVGRLLNRAFGRPVPGRFVVLYYHGIPSHQRDAFARQMDLLCELATPVPAAFRGPFSSGVRYAAVTFDDGLQSVVDNALDLMADRGIHSTHFVPSKQLGKEPEWDIEPGAEDYSGAVVTTEHIKQLPSTLVSVASHTRTHPHLLELERGDAEIEIHESRKELEALLSVPVTLLSFPYGEYDQELVQQCRDAGYDRVFSISPGYASRTPNEFLTARVPASPDDSVLAFRLKLLGAYNWRPLASRIARAVRP